MHARIVQMVVFVVLAGCTTQYLEINIAREKAEGVHLPPPISQSEPGGVGKVTDSSAPVASSISIHQEPPKVIFSTPTQSVASPCPKFVLPTLKALPPIPKAIQSGVKLTDNEMIELLTEYARALKKVELENNVTLKGAYKRYSDSCKK